MSEMPEETDPVRAAINLRVGQTELQLATFISESFTEHLQQQSKKSPRTTIDLELRIHILLADPHI